MNIYWSGTIFTYICTCCAREALALHVSEILNFKNVLNIKKVKSVKNSLVCYLKAFVR